MFLLHALIYITLATASYLAWKKYNDRFMLWCAWIAVIGLTAHLWQYSADNIFALPDTVRNASLLLVEALRFVILVLLVVAGIRLFRP
jgi:hypothetical protein